MTEKKITIHSKTYEDEAITLLVEEKLSSSTQQEWEKDLYAFILEWFSPVSYVTVQTSGSTGVPRSIRLEKRKMLHSARNTLNYFHLRKGQSALLCLPVKYIAGKMMVVRAILGGLNILPILPAANINPYIPEDTIHFTALLPMQAYHLAASDNLSRFEQLIIGGGVVSKELEKRLTHVKTACYETYGMTETITHVALRRMNRKNPDKAFYALPGIHFSNDDRGCLVIQADYLGKKPVVTNDLVELISPEQFRWLGRHDHVINSGGIKIIPELWEKKLEAHISLPYCISSVPHPVFGEEVVLVLETKILTREVKSDIENCLKEEPEFRFIKKIIFLPVFPRTFNAKLKRSDIKREISSAKKIIEII